MTTTRMTTAIGKEDGAPRVPTTKLPPCPTDLLWLRKLGDKAADFSRKRRSRPCDRLYSLCLQQQLLRIPAMFLRVGAAVLPGLVVDVPISRRTQILRVTQVCLLPTREDAVEFQLRKAAACPKPTDEAPDRSPLREPRHSCNRQASERESHCPQFPPNASRPCRRSWLSMTIKNSWQQTCPTLGAWIPVAILTTASDADDHDPIRLTPAEILGPRVRYDHGKASSPEKEERP